MAKIFISLILIVSLGFAFLPLIPILFQGALALGRMAIPHIVRNVSTRFAVRTVARKIVTNTKIC